MCTEPNINPRLIQRRQQRAVSGRKALINSLLGTGKMVVVCCPSYHCTGPFSTKRMPLSGRPGTVARRRRAGNDMAPGPVCRWWYGEKEFDEKANVDWRGRRKERERQKEKKGLRQDGLRRGTRRRRPMPSSLLRIWAHIWTVRISYVDGGCLPCDLGPPGQGQHNGEIASNIVQPIQATPVPSTTYALFRCSSSHLAEYGVHAFTRIHVPLYTHKSALALLRCNGPQYLRVRR